METDEPAAEKRYLDVVEAAQECLDVVGREHVEVGRILVWRSTPKEGDAALQMVDVRHGSDEHTSVPQKTVRLAHNALRESEVLEQLSHDHRIEALIGKRKIRLHIGENRLDPQLRRCIERDAIDINPHHVVALEEGTRERS